MRISCEFFRPGSLPADRKQYSGSGSVFLIMITCTIDNTERMAVYAGLKDGEMG